MNEPSYPFSNIEDKFSFEFDSVSDAKTVRKLIEFRLIDAETLLYNLALVDILPDGSASDLSVSNNQDMPKILATVFQAIGYFFGINPQVKILIQGSTKARTRLYQIAINKYFNEVEHKFSYCK
jgi:hypothetical protein